VNEAIRLISDVTFQAIQGESISSQVKHGEHAMINPDLARDERLAILVEEVGEVATAMNYDEKGKRDDIVKELLQVAAMAASWAQVEDEKEQDSAVPAMQPPTE
jgi:hypothetical protein